MLGVTTETVRSWEAGRSSPRGHRREAYAELLHAPSPSTETAPTTQTASTTKTASTTETAPLTEAASTAKAAPITKAASITEAAPTIEAASTSIPTYASVFPSASMAGAGAGAEVGTKPEVETGGGPLEPADALPDTAELPAAEGPDPEHPTATLTPAQAFDELYVFCAHTLVRQTYLLTGRRKLARESMERAFQLAWRRWPEVAVDPDPAGWVRAAAHEYAMSPWHQLRPRSRNPESPPARADRRLLSVLLDLPPAYRRTLLLHDGLGLGLPDTAAETQASTRAAANRLLYAREAIAERLPNLADPPTLRRRLMQLASRERFQVTAKPAVVRSDSERRARLWTRAALAFTTLLIGSTALTLTTAPDRYEPPVPPGEAVRGVPPPPAPGTLSHRQLELREKLKSETTNGAERLVPQSH